METGGHGRARTRTVFHVSTSDADVQASALGNVSNLLADDTVDLDDVAVVVNAGAVAMTVHGAANGPRVRTLARDGVSFRLCSNLLGRSDHDESDVLDEVTVVSSAMAERTRPQDDGYAYIRP